MSRNRKDDGSTMSRGVPARAIPCSRCHPFFARCRQGLMTGDGARCCVEQIVWPGGRHTEKRKGGLIGRQEPASLTALLLSTRRCQDAADSIDESMVSSFQYERSEAVSLNTANYLYLSVGALNRVTSVIRPYSELLRWTAGDDKPRTRYCGILLKQ